MRVLENCQIKQKSNTMTAFLDNLICSFVIIFLCDSVIIVYNICKEMGFPRYLVEIHCTVLHDMNWFSFLDVLTHSNDTINLWGISLIEISIQPASLELTLDCMGGKRSLTVGMSMS